MYDRAVQLKIPFLAGSSLPVSYRTPEIRVPLGTGIAGAVALSGATVNLADPYRDERFNPEIDRRTGFVTRNLLTLPMKAGDGRVLGVFQVLNKRTGEFSPEDVELLTSLASSAALAVESARPKMSGEQLGSGGEWQVASGE